MKRHFRAMLMTVAAFSALAGVLMAADEDQHPMTKITLHPAAAPVPVLKYQLLPPLLDRRPGNAAVWYLKVPHERNWLFSDAAFWETLERWREMPLAELRKEREKDGGKCSWIAGSGSGLIEELEYGARCEWCNWDMPIHDHDYYSIRLPEIQAARVPARLLAARARLQIADGKYDDAVRTFQIGFALGRHVSEGPTLVQCLVGNTIVGIMSWQLETFIQQPDAPNLYWALASLPRPMIDFRPAIEADMAAIYLSHPELRELDTKKYTAAHWQEVLERVVDTMYGAITKSSDWPPPAVGKDKKQWLATAVREGYPRAKAFLIAQGRLPADVEAMPVPQVILLYTMQTYDELRDEMLACLLMPYPAARKGMEQILAKLRESHAAGREIIPLADVLLPVVGFSKPASARVDRNIAMLEILEAIRMYAAAHDGQLPGSLSDITEVPIPLDPFRGEPFLYERDGDTAILDAPSHVDTYTRYYQIQLER